MPSQWEQDPAFPTKVEELIGTVVGMNSHKTPVWFWLCDLQSVGTIQTAMKKFGFGRLWSGVATNIQSGQSTNQIPTKAVKGIVCGTQNYSEKCPPLCLDLNSSNLFESPLSADFRNPKSTDTHTHFCKTPKPVELMQQLLQLAIQPDMKVLELFARTGPVMKTVIAAEGCSCLAVDSSSVACRYISQSIHRDLEIRRKLSEQQKSTSPDENIDMSEVTFQNSENSPDSTSDSDHHHKSLD